MGYQLLAELVMLLHFGFLAYVALGGFLAWRRARLIVPHVAAAIWGAISATVGIPCPLTAWEDTARRLAGEQGLTRGFINTYLTGVVYPVEHLRTAQLLVAALVLVSWTGFALRLHHRRQATGPSAVATNVAGLIACPGGASQGAARSPYRAYWQGRQRREASSGRARTR